MMNFSETILLLSVCLLPSLILLSLLILLLGKNLNQSSQMLRALLTDQRIENQSLRNQLRSADQVSLIGLQNATQPVDAAVVNREPTEFPDEEYEWAKEGYSMSQPPEEFAAQGWSPTVIMNDEGGDPVAFDRS